MEKIKFRVFYNGKMQPCEITMDDYVHIFDQEDNEFMIVGSVGDGRLVKRIHVMQFTGICDANGKEIFEGDVVKLIFRSFEKIGKVVFDKATFLVECNDSEYLLGLMSCLELSIEIIGNIYENKDIVDDLKQKCS